MNSFRSDKHLMDNVNPGISLAYKPENLAVIK
jgi:hypothetical protein